MFVVLVGTDTQYLIDMLEEMFGEGPVVDPEELLTIILAPNKELTKEK